MQQEARDVTAWQEGVTKSFTAAAVFYAVGFVPGRPAW